MISLVSSIDLKAVPILPARGPWILLVVFLEDGVSIRNEIKSPESTLAKGPGPYGGCWTTRCCCNWINSTLIPIVCRLSVVELCHHLFKIPMKGWNTLSGFLLFPETSHKYLHNSNVSRLCAYIAGKRWMDIFAYICKSLKCIKIEKKQHIPEEILSVNFIIFPVTCISVYTEVHGSRLLHGSRD